MRIAFVVGAYPSWSELFIEREVQALEARGVEVELFALWRARWALAELAARHAVHTCRRRVLPRPCARPGAVFRWQCLFLAAACREPLGAARGLRYLSTASEMARRFRELRVERVHAHFGNTPSTVGWVAASLAGLPFSLAVHARDVFVEPQFLAAKARDAEVVVACNSAAAERARRLVGAADRHKVTLVPHGLTLDDHPLRAAAAEGRRLVVGVGRLVEKKGFVFLVRAMARLRDKGVAARCCLVGDGPQRKALAREVERLKLGEAVELRGWLSQEELKAVYRQASALAAPSVVARDGDMDGLPNVVVEAAAMGLPVVATAVGGIGDLVRDGETGLVARAGDADDLAAKLEEVLEGPAVARARALRAHAVVRARFDEAKATPQLLAALGG